MSLYDSYQEKCTKVLAYTHTTWGELIYGTKDQLMSLGIGMGIVFPSDRRTVSCLDPRGYRTKIGLSEYRGEGIYSASIYLPGRDHPREKWVWFDEGVELQFHTYWDEYKGDAKSFVAAGLVSPEFLPGQPGMGKVQVTIDADGKRRTDTNGWKKREAGAKTIKKISRTLFLVSVAVSQEVRDIRCVAYKQRDDEWEEKMLALPRPKSLTTLSIEEIISFKLRFAKRDKKFQHMISSLAQSNFDE